MSDKYQKLVWAVFADMDAAELAVDAMKSWDKASKDVKLGAIGAVYKNKKGHLKTKKFGRRNIGKGAGIGAVIGVLAAVLPAVGLVGGLAAGAVAGGTLGIFNKKSLGLGKDELQKISDSINENQVVVLALTDDEAEANGLIEVMTAKGGTNAGSEWVTEEGLDEADEVVGQIAEE